MAERKNIPKVLIIEDSPIIRDGLTNILLNKNNTPIDIIQCDSSCDWEHIIVTKLPSILITDPNIFNKHKKTFHLLNEKKSFHFVGLIYAYFQPNYLLEFDAVIHINDHTETIQSTINELLHNQEKQNPSTEEILSNRETEVLKWLANGYSTKKIAHTLNISVHTVNAHRKNIMKKLEIKTISGLTIYAVINNVIDLSKVYD